MRVETMTDRELLELAAKAAGAEITRHENECWESGKTSVCYMRGSELWDPLVDDGDSFWLAVKLDICLRLQGDDLTGIAHWHRNGKTNRVVGNYHTSNRDEARVLVVRAAAEIGRSMP